MIEVKKWELKIKIFSSRSARDIAERTEDFINTLDETSELRDIETKVVPTEYGQSYTFIVSYWECVWEEVEAPEIYSIPLD